MLDLLFTPGVGWAYQILKIETGGDCQSTWGTEALSLTLTLTLTLALALTLTRFVFNRLVTSTVQVTSGGIVGTNGG